MISITLQDVQRAYPEIADRIIQEYERRNGFVPYELGYCYMMQACGTNYYKLGKTTNPDRRLLQIAPQMPFTTRFIRIWRSNFMSMGERWLHELLDQYRSNGEWFELPDDTRDLILNRFDHEYAEGIRNTYGFVFMKTITNGNQQLAADFGEWLFNTSHEVLYTGLFDTSAMFVAWIEDIFMWLEMQALQFPEDIAQQYARERAELAERAKKYREQSDQGEQES